MFFRKYFLFTRRKISFFVIPFLLASTIFILYQISIFIQLSNQSINKTPQEILIRGIHKEQARFYKPNEENKFKCIRSFEEIDFKMVNDNYCDCLDGSDEPGTNACSNGIFYCQSQKKAPRSIFSSMVNDGICDCCDGSDEWILALNNFKKESTEEMYKYHAICPNTC